MIPNNSPGTCNWILNSSRYKEWQDSNVSMLWLKGSPGAGKSVLAKFIFRTLLSKVITTDYETDSDTNRTTDATVLQRASFWPISLTAESLHAVIF